MNIDWHLFLQMGGQGPYVWGSYGAALVLLVGEAVALYRRARRATAARGEGSSC
ncbi:heme exporter protein CcmD [Aquabacterium sp. A7-Y]|uniref:heme exporter protein CcmD n=1 Tax=Aquabacterium sp. A7-Y TaxID=1349605 RepID=UPI00223E1C12|nr:heme exporter protein CcmD [Aquabacterium sp. A7-Y]MCW7537909.1 heme exporter protein CcmD [Aquabacterium sp. A7-Y]